MWRVRFLQEIYMVRIVWSSGWRYFWKELLLVTDVSTTWSEVIFRVKWVVFVRWWCYMSGSLKLIGQFSHDGIGWKSRVKFVISHRSVFSPQLCLHFEEKNHDKIQDVSKTLKINEDDEEEKVQLTIARSAIDDAGNADESKTAMFKDPGVCRRAGTTPTLKSLVRSFSESLCPIHFLLP